MKKAIVIVGIILAGVVVYGKTTTGDNVSANAATNVKNNVTAVEFAAGAEESTKEGVEEKTAEPNETPDVLKAKGRTGRVYEFKHKDSENGKVESDSDLVIGKTEENIVAINGYGEENAHRVYLDTNLAVEMCNSEHLSNVYLLKNNVNEIVGIAEFDDEDTKGSIVDMDGNVVAKYYADINKTDATVIVYDNDICDDMNVLMIIAEYMFNRREVIGE